MKVKKKFETKNHQQHKIKIINNNVINIKQIKS